MQVPAPPGSVSLFSTERCPPSCWPSTATSTRFPTQSYRPSCGPGTSFPFRCLIPEEMVFSKFVLWFLYYNFSSLFVLIPRMCSTLTTPLRPPRWGLYKGGNGVWGLLPPTLTHLGLTMTPSRRHRCLLWMLLCSLDG